MMRVVSLVLVGFVVAVVLITVGDVEGGKIKIHNWPERLEELKVKDKIGDIPATLAEAHAELERMLSPEGLAKIDAMTSEREMHREHFFGLGGDLLTGWKLEHGSVLAQHMEELGFAYAYDMADAIVDTFWCKRHGRDLRLDERAAESRRQWEEDWRAVEEYKRCVRDAAETLRSGMMGLRFEKRDVRKVTIAVRTEEGVRVRFLCPFRDGVFLTVNRGFCAQGYYFDPADGQIHRVDVPEIKHVLRAVVAGGRMWLAGFTDEKPVVVGIGDRDRVTVPLPRDGKLPDLGLDGSFLLSVYAKTIYRLEDRTWTLVHSGDVLLPRSGLPPQRHGNLVFFREEQGTHERDGNRLAWLAMTEPVHLGILDEDLRALAEAGGLLYEVTSYCVTSGGDLWVCSGKYWRRNCLLRRALDGSYSIAAASGSVRYVEGWPETRIEYAGAAACAVTALPDETLLLAGRTGLYRLQGGELVQELAFAVDRPSKWVKEPDRMVSRVVWRRRGDKMVKEDVKVLQKAPEKGREVRSSVPWTPTTVLQLDDGSYFLGTDTWEGAYWIRRDDKGQWTCLSANEGDPVVW